MKPEEIMVELAKKEFRQKGINDQIAWLEKAGCNMVYPITVTEMFQPGADQRFYQLTYEVLRFDPDPSPGKPDCYREKRWKEGQVAHTLTALMRLKNAAGMRIGHPVRIDDMSNRNMVVFEVTGMLKKLDGTWLTESASKEIDLDVQKEKLEWQYRNDSESERAYKVERDLRQLREHKHSHAESKAKARLIRAMLGLQSTYDRSQFAMPWVVVHVELSLPMQDPMVKKALIEAAIGAERLLYGYDKSRVLLSGGQVEAEVINNGGNGKAEEPFTEPVQELSPEPSPEERLENIRRSWEDVSKADRIAKIDELLKATGYQPKSGSLSPDQLDAKKQVEYIMFLLKKKVETPVPAEKPLPF